MQNFPSIFLSVSVTYSEESFSFIFPIRPSNAVVGGKGGKEETLFKLMEHAIEVAIRSP
jgi:hypothetical protein